MLRCPHLLEYSIWTWRALLINQQQVQQTMQRLHKAASASARIGAPPVIHYHTACHVHGHAPSCAALCNEMQNAPLGRSLPTADGVRSWFSESATASTIRYGKAAVGALLQGKKPPPRADSYVKSDDTPALTSPTEQKELKKRSSSKDNLRRGSVLQAALPWPRRVPLRP